MNTRPVYLHGYELGPDGEPTGEPPVYRLTVYDRGDHAAHGGPSDTADLIARAKGLKVVLTNDRGEAYAAFYPDGRVEFRP